MRVNLEKRQAFDEEKPIKIFRQGYLLKFSLLKGFKRLN